MQVHFNDRENGPERLVCEAEIHFEEGPLSGTQLVGFCLWRSPEGEVYVTFPSRAFGAGSRAALLRLPPGHRRQRRDGQAREGVDPRRVPQGRGRGLRGRAGAEGEPPPPVLSTGDAMPTPNPTRPTASPASGSPSSASPA